jgi:hypothetical protein
VRAPEEERKVTLPVAFEGAELVTTHEPPAPVEPEVKPAAAPQSEKRAPAAPPVDDAPPKKSEAVEPSPRVASTKPKKSEPSAPESSAEDASAFGGEEGAFIALVCFVSRRLRSALALDDCKPVTLFRTNHINVSPRAFKRGFPGVEKRIEWFGIDYRGRFKVRATGYYTFRLVSDDGAVLFIDGSPVLDNDGIHPPTEAKTAIPLSAGDHEFRLLYYQGPGTLIALQLFVKGNKTPERPFGPAF